MSQGDGEKTTTQHEASLGCQTLYDLLFLIHLHFLYVVRNLHWRRPSFQIKLVPATFHAACHVQQPVPRG